MFGETLAINPDEIDSAAVRGRIQGIAAETLRAAGVHFAEDDRTPFDILASMPEYDEDGSARAQMLIAANSRIRL
jgi:hypothetical protein